MQGIIISRHERRPQTALKPLPKGPRRWATVPGVTYPDTPMPIVLPPEPLDPAIWVSTARAAEILGYSVGHTRDRLNGMGARKHPLRRPQAGLYWHIEDVNLLLQQQNETKRKTESRTVSACR